MLWFLVGYWINTGYFLGHFGHGYCYWSWTHLGYRREWPLRVRCCIWRVGYLAITLRIPTSLCYRSEWKPSLSNDCASSRTTIGHYWRLVFHLIHLSQMHKTPLLHLPIAIAMRTFSFLITHFNFAVHFALILWRLERFVIIQTAVLTFLDESLKTLHRDKKSLITPSNSYALFPVISSILTILPNWDLLQFLLSSKKL